MPSTRRFLGMGCLSLSQDDADVIVRLRFADAKEALSAYFELAEELQLNRRVVVYVRDKAPVE